LEQPRLVEELGGLEVREPALQVFRREVGDRPQQLDGDVLTEDGRGLDQAFSDSVNDECSQPATPR
jgi:hypothetical protein